MTDEPAAIQASFADFRLIKGRKQAQIILEIPIEGADAALAALGGIPQPQSDRWVAVARLNGASTINESLPPDETFEVSQDPKPKKNITYGELASKEKRKWDDLKSSMQAAIRCNEPAFQRFMREVYDSEAHGDDDEDAANAVRHICGVDSRSGLNDNLEAAERWRQLERSYQAWLKAAE
jgi:hypothetical protein